jgi:hypothetical protein
LPKFRLNPLDFPWFVEVGNPKLRVSNLGTEIKR